MGGAKSDQHHYHPWSTTHLTNSRFSSVKTQLQVYLETWASITHTIPSKGLIAPNLAKQVAFRRTCAWKPNKGKVLGFPQLLRPGVWAKHTHRIGPPWRELSISVGDKCHPRVTALYTDNMPPTPLPKRGK